eukprot:INCI3664.1.p1 GENE.INCI3664.1~~INCI3664.1.p1  ORF type:complete len:711 (+),score=107.93 INCI3664.1:177-2309(+)
MDKLQSQRWMKQSKRVIVHCDLDCFYVQVERKLRPELKDRPVAVAQYTASETIIALSYEAKAQGVKRQMNGTDARLACPDIAICQVPVLNEKADLTRYRDAGSQVFEICDEFGSGCERTSIDEAYLDITDASAAFLKIPYEEKLSRVGACSALKTFVLRLRPEIPSQKWLETLLLVGDPSDGCNNIKHNNAESESLKSPPSLRDFDVPEDSVSPISEKEGHALRNLRLLAAGVVVCSEMRTRVFQQTGFTLSAGIASNRLLSKLVSGMHKPNKQTLVVPLAAMELLRTLPVQSLNGFGGKLGTTLVNERGIELLGELRSFETVQSLLTLTGGNHNLAQWAWDACRGIDLKPVVTRLMSKSIGCGKTFRGKDSIRRACPVVHYFGCLAEELSDRLQAMWNRFGQAPTLMTVHISYGMAMVKRRGVSVQVTSHGKSRGGPVSVLELLPKLGSKKKNTKSHDDVPLPATSAKSSVGPALQGYLHKRILAIVRSELGRALPSSLINCTHCKVTALADAHSASTAGKPGGDRCPASDFELPRRVTGLSVTLSKFQAGVKAKNRIDQFVVGKEPHSKTSSTISTSCASRKKKPVQNSHSESEPRSEREKSAGTLKAMLQSNRRPPASSSVSHSTTLGKSEWMSPVRPDQVDQAVLAELPREIQLELQRQAGQVNLSRTTARKAPKGIGRWFSSANKKTERWLCTQHQPSQRLVFTG